MRTLLISVDGMRPDALEKVPEAQEIMKDCALAMDATTVMPSVTLPCHVSLFLSVDPSRHGNTTNIYTPQVRPIDGLCEVLYKNEKTSAMFFNWGQLRDLTKPWTVTHSCFYHGSKIGWEKTNTMVTDAAIKYLGENYTDFAFLYMGHLDIAGHDYGWMTEGYIEALKSSWKNIGRIMNSLPDDYTVIITSDHGGHERSHGTDLPEDMTIPVIIKGEDFPAGKELKNVNIKDIPPTIAKLLGVAPDAEWEGKSLL